MQKISPRIRYQIRLPDEPAASTSSAWAQLALLVVAVNIVACLIASRGVTVGEHQAAASIESRQRAPGTAEPPSIIAPIR